jgi:hypothetical protein
MKSILGWTFIKSRANATFNDACLRIISDEILNNSFDIQGPRLYLSPLGRESLCACYVSERQFGRSVCS